MKTPESLHIHKKSAELEVLFSNEKPIRLSAEYLRVFSPSAETKGHGPGQEVLQYGKRAVQFLDLEFQGNYAVKISFSDGHNSGIYSWDYLIELATNFEQNWSDYLRRLAQEKRSRDPIFIDAISD
ncbi:MAG: gamma-butyrobetaine hydroxylase-like domain-containing protein [Candidatus Azotimanducaceae bacterium]